jgi:DNA-binding PadR family transcriptional regulator
MVDLSLETEMNRGFLQLLVLVMLEEPMYGYMISKELENRDFSIEENTLYPLLRRLEKKGLVRSEWRIEQDKPRKYYSITSAGNEVKQKLLSIWTKQMNLIDTFRGGTADE